VLNMIGGDGRQPDSRATYPLYWARVVLSQDINLAPRKSRGRRRLSQLGRLQCSMCGEYQAPTEPNSGQERSALGSIKGVGVREEHKPPFQS
jgi:hypothetical protein